MNHDEDAVRKYMTAALFYADTRPYFGDAQGNNSEGLTFVCISSHSAVIDISLCFCFPPTLMFKLTYTIMINFSLPLQLSRGFRCF